jgi:RNA polymerase sigma-70 factor (ECF subfamily)
MAHDQYDGGGSSTALLRRAQTGDSSAVERLVEKYLPRLRRWASGRLPRWARGTTDTVDVVHDSVLHVFSRLDRFEPRRRGALQAYLREAVRNRIRDELRRAQRLPRRAELDDTLPDEGPSPLEQAIGDEAALRYVEALRSLRHEDQQAIVARVELGYSYEQIALILNRRTSDAARMVMSRALVRLTEAMDRLTTQRAPQTEARS